MALSSPALPLHFLLPNPKEEAIKPLLLQMAASPCAASPQHGLFLPPALHSTIHRLVSHISKSAAPPSTLQQQLEILQRSLLTTADVMASDTQLSFDSMIQLTDAISAADDLADELEYKDLEEKVEQMEKAAANQERSAFQLNVFREFHTSEDYIGSDVGSSGSVNKKGNKSPIVDGSFAAEGADSSVCAELCNGSSNLVNESTNSKYNNDDTSLDASSSHFADRIMKIVESLNLVSSYLADAKGITSLNCDLSRPPKISYTDKAASSLSAGNMFGYNDARERLVEKLLESDEENVSIFPIFGPGGVGKTTLAHFVYSDQRVVKYFHSRVWICASDDLNVMRIAGVTANPPAMSNSHTSHELEKLKFIEEVLQDQLQEKRFLLVLDDVQSIEWTARFGSLKNCRRGSKIVITARKEGVLADREKGNKIILKGLMKGACQLGYMENFEEGSKIAITTREERVVDDRSKANKIVFKGLKQWMACFGSRKNYVEGSNTVTTAPDETVADDRDKANKIVLKQNRQKEYWLPCFGCMDNCGKDGNIVMTASEEALEDDRVKQKKNILEDQKEDDFLSFFSRCAFGYEDPQKYPELQIIAKGIATKLKGSPLAAKAVGGLLQTKFTNEHWTKFLHELPELEEDLTDIMPALSLCYQFLPPPLKWCFAYCSMFPKGYPFNVDNIVNIWISQGFIQPTDSNKIVEDVGREYFDHLVSMSFFELPNYTRSYWKSSYHVMHDLFLDLAKSVVGASECSSYKNKRCFDQTTSHLYIQSWCEHDDVHQWKYFRSVIVNTIHAINFGVLMRIRVLDLSYSCMTELPDCIGDCIYLRYLDLAGNSLHKLPDSLCKLYHLQFLVVPDMCRRLPRRVNSLIKLRYLNASNEAVTRIAGIGSLTSLQELKEFDVKVTKGHDIGQLKELRELRGQLCIRNLGTVKRKEEVIEANLSGKTRIEKLQLKWQRRKAVKVWVDVDEVLECLEPPPNLKELEIHWFGGCRTPSWLEKQSLTLLQSIHLKGCKRWQQLPPLGYLPVLQFLGIDSMDATIDGGDGSVEIFPTLRELWLADASIFLDGISFEDQSRKFFHQLRKLSAVNCKTVKGLPPLSLFSSLEELEIKMCPDLENELPLCLKDLNKLKTLKISTPNLTCFPDEMMQHLKHLEIDTCQNLVSWLVEDKEDALHSSLSSLSVINSPLPTGSILLTSLRELKIDRCSKIRVFTKEQKDWFAYLTSLRNLCITNCMNLVTLPPNLHQLGSLEKLTISGCLGLKSLPSDLPNSLRVLEIWNCNQGFTFQYLGEEAPEWIKSIPYKSIAYRKFENVNKDCSLEKVRN